MKLVCLCLGTDSVHLDLVETELNLMRIFRRFSMRLAALPMKCILSAPLFGSSLCPCSDGVAMVGIYTRMNVYLQKKKKEEVTSNYFGLT